MAEQETTGTALFLDDMAKAAIQALNIAGQVVHQLTPMFQQISTLIHEQYEEAGSPYGDTQEGMMQWLKEMGEKHHRQNEAELLQVHLELLEYARRISERIEARGKRYGRGL